MGLLDLVYSKEEVAKELSVPVSTIGYLIRNGRLPAIKIGRRYVIRKETLEQWLIDNESIK